MRSQCDNLMKDELVPNAQMRESNKCTCGWQAPVKTAYYQQTKRKHPHTAQPGRARESKLETCTPDAHHDGSHGAP